MRKKKYLGFVTVDCLLQDQANCFHPLIYVDQLKASFSNQHTWQWQTFWFPSTQQTNQQCIQKQTSTLTSNWKLPPNWLTFDEPKIRGKNKNWSQPKPLLFHSIHQTLENNGGFHNDFQGQSTNYLQNGNRTKKSIFKF